MNFSELFKQSGQLCQFSPDGQYLVSPNHTVKCGQGIDGVDNLDHAQLHGICSGSSGRVRGGGREKHEINAAAFGGHLFMTYFHRASGAMTPLAPPPDPLLGMQLHASIS